MMTVGMKTRAGIPENNTLDPQTTRKTIDPSSGPATPRLGILKILLQSHLMVAQLRIGRARSQPVCPLMDQG